MTGSPLFFPVTTPHYPMGSVTCTSVDTPVQAPHTHTCKSCSLATAGTKVVYISCGIRGEGVGGRMPKKRPVQAPRTENSRVPVMGRVVYRGSKYRRRTVHSELRQSLLKQGSRAGPHCQGLRTALLQLQSFSDLHNSFRRTVEPELFT